MENNLFLKPKLKLVALAMSVLMLTGCGDKVPGFDYASSESGVIEVNGAMDYSNVSKLKLVRLVNEKSGYEGYFLVYKFNSIGGRGVPGKLEYVNVENDKVIYCDSDEMFNNFKMEVLVEQLIDYLYKYDMLKEKYTIEDILDIKECLLSDEVLFPNLTASKPNVRRRIRIIDEQNNLFVI